MKPIRILTGALIGIMLISVPAFAFGRGGMQRNEKMPQMRCFDEAKATERLKEDVASGKITQEKADEILANLKEGKPLRGRPDGERLMRNFDPERMSERLKEDVASGKITQEKADQILADMTAKAKEAEAKRAQIIAEQKAKVEQDLKDGKITQEQADKALAILKEGKPLRGGFGGRAPRMGGCGANCTNQAS